MINFKTISKFYKWLANKNNGATISYNKDFTVLDIVFDNGETVNVTVG